jgi:hypothetical protein|tara:strand:+ start:2927 stop:3277 length:351 start_codon:yes stop_codon:yes gene_type:complete
MKKPKRYVKSIESGGTRIRRHGERDSRDMGIREELSEHYGDDLLFADGYDGAIIGVCSGFDSGRVAYSVAKMIEICAKDLCVDYDEAAEWLEYNTFGAYVGENTPIYIEGNLINDN